MVVMAIVFIAKLSFLATAASCMPTDDIPCRRRLKT